MAVTRPVFLPSALDAAGSSTPNTPLIDEGDELEYHIKDEDNDENEIVLRYKGVNNMADRVDMELSIKLDGTTLVSKWSGELSRLASKPFSVKNVVHELFKTIIKLTESLIPKSVDEMLREINILELSTGGKYEYYYKNLVPVIMQKLSGDFGQEVSACGGIIKGGVAYPITQAHNDIPAFLRGVLLSSMRNRPTELQPQAPVIFQTAHSGRYLDSRP